MSNFAFYLTLKKRIEPVFWRRRCGSPTLILKEGLPALPKQPISALSADYKFRRVGEDVT
jgi:hypothetical protein